MAATIIDRLSKELEKRGYSVYKFSKETGIPSQRIYKWIDKKGSPKVEDANIINKWINNIVDKVTPKEKTPDSGLSIAEDQYTWIVSSIMLLSDELVKLQVRVFDRSLEDCLQELENSRKLIVQRMKNLGT